MTLSILGLGKEKKNARKHLHWKHVRNDGINDGDKRKRCQNEISHNHIKSQDVLTTH